MSKAKVLVCSQIPNLMKCLSSNPGLKSVEFKEISPSDLLETSDSFRNQVVISDGDHIGPLLYKPHENFGFIQGTWAGIDALIPHVQENRPLPELKVCRFADSSFAQIMAEYLIAHIINTERKFNFLRSLQQEKIWNQKGASDYRCLNELTIGVLGIGEMGKVVAKLLKSFNCRILGLVRTMPTSNPCPYVDTFYEDKDLGKLLQQSDYICNVLPKTSNTNNLLGNGVLSNCKGRGSTLINIGRGNILSDEDLLLALKENWIKCAILDVFPVEPLKSDHPFWSHEKIVVTPHVAGTSRPQDIAKCFERNWTSFINDKPLSYLINWSDQY